jgi:hypothetical protein
MAADRPVPAVFLGLQLVFPSPPGDALAEELRKVVREASRDLEPRQKLRFLQRLEGLLGRVIPRAIRGYWDLLTDPAAAEAEYRDWVSDLQAVEAGGGGAPDPDAHAIVTVALRVAEGSPGDDTLRDVCDVPEKDFFRRRTFERLASALPRIDLDSVLEDAVAVVPGNPGEGPTLEDLEDEGYDYLHRLVP